MPSKKGGKTCTLTITSTPYKSSFLAIPPSPFSPRTPITFTRSPPPKSLIHTSELPRLTTTSTPSPTMPWIWSCHQCHRSYPLGVTRRCLDDGHHFCSGTTTIHSWRTPVVRRKTKRHRACASEFDYQGWKTWGQWKRGGTQNKVRQIKPEQGAVRPKKDCWNMCDYPSECRWGKRFGIHTPIDEVVPALERCSQPMPLLIEPLFIEEGTMAAEDCSTLQAEGSEKYDVWTTLAQSAERRRANTECSPLKEEQSVGTAGRDADGDVIMDTIDPRLLSGPEAPDTSTSLDCGSIASSASSAASSAVDMLKDLMKRKSLRRDKSRKYAVPMLTVSKSVVIQRDAQSYMSYPESLLDEFAPLERVPSRDSGNLSILDISSQRVRS